MVTHCVCQDISFARLKELHQERGLDLAALAALTRCGTKCGNCIPYIRLMLNTGVTSFSPISAQAFARLGIEMPTQPLA